MMIVYHTYLGGRNNETAYFTNPLETQYLNFLKMFDLISRNVGNRYL